MTTLFSRYALTSCVTAALLTGCGGSQPPIGAPGAVPQSRAIAQQAAHGKSWMLPTASSGGKLLYVSNENTISVFTLPDGDLVGTLPGDTPVGLCSDKNGNVFVVNEGSAQVVEYAHGGTAPIKTLDDYGNQPNGCYVDPTTGNLAVVGGGLNIEDSVAIYPNASSSPTVYKTDAGGYFLYCTFDNKGNLFVNVGDEQNEAIWELPKGGNALVQFSLDKTLGPDGGLQWDGKYLDIQNAPGPGPMNEPGPIMIYQVKIAGSAGTVVHTILMDSSRNPKNDRQSGLGSQFWIQGHRIYTRVHGHGPEGVWHYPSGGTRIRSFQIQGNLLGVTVSVSPSH